VTQFSLPAAQSGEPKLVTKTNSKEMNANRGGEDFNFTKELLLLEQHSTLFDCGDWDNVPFILATPTHEDGNDLCQKSTGLLSARCIHRPTSAIFLTRLSS
jgi:hypothetical protein